jgi:hypothetical protein
MNLDNDSNNANIIQHNNELGLVNMCRKLTEQNYFSCSNTNYMVMEVLVMEAPTSAVCSEIF